MELRLFVKIYECVVLSLVRWRATKMAINSTRRIFCHPASMEVCWVLPAGVVDSLGRRCLRCLSEGGR